MAVWIPGGVAEEVGDTVLEALGKHVLEDLGFGVHLVPGDTESLGEIGLQKAVVAHDLERDLAPRRG